MLGEESAPPVAFCFLPELPTDACPSLPGSDPRAGSGQAGNAAVGLQRHR